MIQKISRWICGNASNVSFWHDNWLGYVIYDKIGTPLAFKKYFHYSSYNYYVDNIWNLEMNYCDVYPDILNHISLRIEEFGRIFFMVTFLPSYPINVPILISPMLIGDIGPVMLLFLLAGLSQCGKLFTTSFSHGMSLTVGVLKAPLFAVYATMRKRI